MAKLVSIGDSLTQGFQSGAICRSDLSYPSMIAKSMGLGTSEFKIPNFTKFGGFPFNIEHFARKISEKYGHYINPIEKIRSIFCLKEYIDKVENYWERGKGSKPTSDTDYHNLAFWGATVSDSYSLTSGECHKKIQINNKNNWFSIPSNSFYRSAFKVLNPSQKKNRFRDTQTSILKRISEKEGIDNLIVNLGANNCLGTVINLEIIEDKNRKRNLWKVEDFRYDYEKLVQEISFIKNSGGKKSNIYLATIPYITIPPVLKGIGKKTIINNKIYYQYYTRFTIQEKSFNPNSDPYLTKNQVIEIDSRIYEYNKIIKTLAKKNGFYIVDICNLLNKLAYKRNKGIVSIPQEFKDLSINFFEIKDLKINVKIKNGGLISLDGLHPTTCGYSLIAQEFINVMKLKNPKIKDINFKKIRKMDTLVSCPPNTLDDINNTLLNLEKYIHFSRLL